MVQLFALDLHDIQAVRTAPHQIMYTNFPALRMASVTLSRHTGGSSQGWSVWHMVEVQAPNPLQRIADAAVAISP